VSEGKASLPRSLWSCHGLNRTLVYTMSLASAEQHWFYRMHIITSR
jgi:hypothetical protein